MTPAIPYAVGWRFTVQLHKPPEPTPVFENGCCNSDIDNLEKERLSPVERCLNHPPLPGCDEPLKIDLGITDLIQVVDQHNAQVVMVDVLGDGQGLQKGMRAVAKFYDPLFANDDDGFLNPFSCVDKHYTHEAAMYMRLSDLAGKQIPNFYGSFSLSIPVDQSNRRTIRLILLEYIPGLSMLNANPNDYDISSRQLILKEVIDFESLVYAGDILLTDFKRRNIILVDDASSRSGKRRVVFLDFGGALFGRTRDDAAHLRKLLFPGTFISPLLRWADCHEDFQCWVDWLWQNWLKEIYGDTEDPITEDMRKLFSR
ncbi:hypothetical protein BDV32DRAFT_132188 [Aspergillus pseudonomiae]|uniref:Uncharacterized protein n=1 Tax=Aspergillus pseudonomiae TaxID=1506151 RepID=A0A5N6HLC9_9EURO|nr:uncharacterized protein BDV37DRAFT_266731 [Aspergillus pseudonomiae]KAB8254569.1 hypothetical protein BDV32DRAFT_132188 [Aspergillus pseudonomiae]KAE8397055.1 hypothetical protein BDV37DRAFT_266731 [Aspergillus pseudonomiae]